MSSSSPVIATPQSVTVNLQVDLSAALKALEVESETEVEVSVRQRVVDATEALSKSRYELGEALASYQVSSPSELGPR